MKRAVAALAALALLAACGGSSSNDNGGSSTSSAFSGVISTDDGLASGSIEFTVSSASPAPPTGVGPSVVVNASGKLKFNGEAAVTLSGDYDTDQDQLVLTGGGYTLGGFFDGQDRLEGAFSGPNNRSGSFVTTKAASGTSFCGHYDATDGSDHGTFSFVVTGSTARGEARSEDGTVIPLDGTVDGNTITFFVPGTTNTLATGTRSGSSVSGQYGGSNPGTWSGSVCN